MSEVKDFLKSYGKAHTQLQLLSNKIEALQTMLELPGVELSERVQNSPDPNRKINKIIELTELKKDAAALFKNTAELLENVQEVISKVENDNEKLVLSKRYILLKNWKEVAEEMHYSRSGVLNIHRKALIDVEKVLKNRKCELL